MAKFTAYELKNWNHCKDFDPTKDATDVIGKIPQVKVPVRSPAFKGDGFITRIILAYGVFTGKYDAIEWREDNTRAVNDFDIKKKIHEMKSRK